MVEDGRKNLIPEESAAAAGEKTPDFQEGTGKYGPVCGGRHIPPFF